jgi:outer membrane protein assembly factor BamB
MSSMRLKMTSLFVLLGMCLSLGTSAGARVDTGSYAAPVASARAASTGNWAQSEYDARRRNYNPFERTIRSSNVAGLSRAWSIPFDGLSNVAIADGRLYLAANGQVVAARVRDGRTLWSYGYTGCPAWQPRSFLASAARVFVYFDDACSETGETDQSLLVALDAATGRLLWQSGVAKYLLWLGLVGNHLLVQTEEPFGLSALGPATGRVQWSTGELEGGFAADHTHVYFAGSDINSGQTVATAFRLGNGVPAWSRPVGPSHKVIVGHGDIFIGGSSAVTFESVVRVLDSSSGAFRYRLKDSSVAAYQPGAVYTMDTLGHTITARHPRTGSPIWSRSFANWRTQQVLIANGVAYTAWILDSSTSLRYSLRAFRTADGKLLLKRAGYDDVKAVAGGTAYATRGGLDALRPRRH